MLTWLFLFIGAFSICAIFAGVMKIRERIQERKAWIKQCEEWAFIRKLGDPDYAAAWDELNKEFPGC